MAYTQDWNREFIKNTAFMERGQTFRIIEIGCFEGGTSNFIVSDLLAWNGQLICIDPLEDDYSLDNDNEMFRGQYDRFIENTQSNKDRITLIRKKSEEVLPYIRSESVDFIYVDGHHAYPEVYFDANESFRILKVGGHLLFDDYLWGNNYPVKQAVDQFLAENPNHTLLLKLNQVLIRKTEPNSPTMNAEDRYQDLSTEKLFNEDTIYAAYTNLDKRTDRNKRMIEELKRVGIKAERRSSLWWEDLYNSYDDEMKNKVGVMYRRTPGAIGCHYSQVAIMEEALRQGKHAWVMEDDLIYSDDLQRRLKIIFKFLNTHEWDIFWFGGTYHHEPNWHKSVEGKHTHPDMQLCHCNLNRDWEETMNPHIVRTYGAFSTHSWLVNKDRIKHILELIDRNVHLSMGIDWIMLKEQPNLFTYAFNPGCCKQFDSQSDISNAFAKQSGFKNLGRHWFSEKMKD